MTPQDIAARLAYLTPAERAELDRLLASLPRWTPLPGPQAMAFASTADVIGYGGAAGGGKTDLACGLALYGPHKKAAIFRREATQLTGIVDRLTELIGSREGYNGSERIWRLRGRQIEFGSVPNLGDERRYQGRPKDLLVIDEATNFLEAQVRFLMGWVRSPDPSVHCQTLMTFNPPTDVDGRWVVEFFGPWLDRKHPRPARPGELRWFATVDGKDRECWSGEPFDHAGETITPMSRTFIPSRITDNPYLLNTGYMATLQSLPEPLRSQMLRGDFLAGVEDDAFQLIPTAWVEAAQARWRERTPKGRMQSIGVDVARQGKDNTVIACRHEGEWFDRPIVRPGRETPDGPTVAGLVIATRRDDAPVHIDVIGVGASPYDFLRGAVKGNIHGVNVSERSLATDKSGRLRFANLRSELGWKFRELLDPAADNGVALPPMPEILADLTAFTWRLSGMAIQVSSREDVIERIGRSPDYASALFLANMRTPRRQDLDRRARDDLVRGHDPLQFMDRG